FFHLGNAPLTITNVELERLSVRTGQDIPPRRWRLLGRLQKSWLGRRDRDGALVVSRYRLDGCLLYGGWPYLRLARGRYRLSVRAATAAPRDSGEPALAVEIFGNSRWRRAGLLKQLSRSSETTGVLQLRQEF